MNPIDDQLNRLFQAAIQVRPDGVAAAPYGLETRVMAAWRAARPGDAGMWDMTLLVRGLLLATVIMGVSLWPVLTQASDPASDYLQLADSTVQVDNTP